MVTEAAATAEDRRVAVVVAPHVQVADRAPSPVQVHLPVVAAVVPAAVVPAALQVVAHRSGRGVVVATAKSSSR